MPMTMRQILAKTPPSRKEKAAVCRIREARVSSTDYGTTVYKAKIFSTHDAQGNPHRGPRNIYVATVETNGKMTVVSCSCQDFCFTWEVALARQRAARIEYSNGKDPKDRNPRYIPGCCGHLFKFGTTLIAKGRVK
jgi:hypothetical protein